MRQKQRRAFHRYATDLPAELQTDRGDLWRCRIRDFSYTGMLLVADAHTPFQHTQSDESWRDQDVTLHFAVGRGDTAQTHAVAARVVRANERRVAVAFARLEPSVHRLLVDHRSPTLTLLGADDARPRTLPLDAAQRHALRAALTIVVEQHFPDIHLAVLRQCADALGEHTRAAASDAEFASASSDLALLEERRGDLLELLLARTLDHAEAFAAGSLVAREADSVETDELELVDDAELEAWLAVSELVRNLEAQLRASLAPLARMVRGLSAGGPAEIPFSPEVVANFLQDVPQRAELSRLGRTVLFNAADRVLLERLPDFYEDLVGALEECGISATAADPAPRPPPPVIAPAEAAAAWRTPPDASQAPVPPQPPQQTGYDGLALRAIRQQLVELLRQQPRGTTVDASLDRQLNERLDIAEHLLQSIYADPHVAPPARPWLEQIKLLLFEAAANQLPFHREVSHPVRRIAGQLEHLGMLLDRDPAHCNDATGKIVSRLVAGLANQGLPDARELARASQMLSVIEAKETSEYQRNVERVVAACEGDARIRRARAYVDEELERRFGGRRIPKLLAELITGGWQSLLQLMHIRHGPASDQSASSWKTLEDLESALTAPRESWGPAGIDPLALVDAVEGGLAFASFDPFHKGQLGNALRQVLAGAPDEENTKGLELAELSLVKRRDAEAAGADAQAPDAYGPPPDVAGEAWEALLERVRQLQPGDCLRIRDEDEGEQLRRVAWIDEQRQRHVLVTPRGLKAESLSETQIARQLHARKVSIVTPARAPLVDRAADDLLQKLEQRLYRDVGRDPVTGLSNRRFLSAAIARSIAASRVSGACPALLVVDLDQFKLINNTYGFEAGDQVLVQIAGLLQQQFGDGGVVAHLGADEFAVLLDNIDRADLLSIADDLRERIRGLGVIGDNGHLRVEASIGAVAIDPLQGGPGQILAAADSACSAAKESGRNRVLLYRDDDELIARRTSSMQWVVRVNEALEHDRLRLRCQRISPLSPASAKAPHYEVLLSVIDSEGRQLMLEPFISAAEHYNRMAAVDRTVVRKTFRWMAEHPAALDSLGGLAINLSGDSLGDPGLADFIADTLRESGANPQKICFEVTETVAVADLAKASDLIRRIKDLGCRFALDDFGSGMASYSYLKSLPVDMVKIDGVFIRDLANNDSDYAVVKSINELSHFLGKETIAEFAENDAILARLRSIGVDYAQGYGIEKPLYLDELSGPDSATRKQLADALARVRVDLGGRKAS